MTNTTTVGHVFVDTIPDALKDRVLYACIPFATVAHRCFCGCGEEVITPLSRADWTLSFDGESISLSPSIGSWSLPCRSHYIITRNEIRWARKWTDNEVDAGRSQDHADRQEAIAPRREPDQPDEEASQPSLPCAEHGWWQRLITRAKNLRT